MAVDLHTHSDYSDGSDAPATIVELAVAAHLSAVALTDHDGIDGNAEAMAAGEGRIEVIPGVELSVAWRDRAVHLLGYWIEPDTPIADLLADIRSNRDDRNREMVAALAGLGIDITDDDIAVEGGRGSVGRPHIAAVLVRKGVVATIADAFDQYLAAGRPAYRGRLRLDLPEAVDLIHRSRGVASVAHPHTIADREAEFLDLFERLSGLGVDGVECHYGEYAPDLRTRLDRHARSLGLVPTGGSDYHGTYKPGLAVGTGRGDLTVPDTVVAELKERRSRG
jgi:3',5'-nucleoside bisphosphate phosphatase